VDDSIDTKKSFAEQRKIFWYTAIFLKTNTKNGTIDTSKTLRANKDIHEKGMML